MKKRFKNMTISRQIKYYYVLLFSIIFLLCGILYIFTVSRITSNSENNTLEYALQVVENNMEAMIENVNDYSKVIAFNDTVQEFLEINVPVSYEAEVALQEEVIQMAACCDGISSICLIDETGKAYMAGDIYEVEALQTHIQGTSVYQSVLKDNTSDNPLIFSYRAESDKNQQIISFVRQIKNLETLDVIGSVAMNIPVRRIMETFSSVSEQTRIEIAILDKEGKLIAATENGSALEDVFVNEKIQPGKKCYKVINIENKNYKVGMMEDDNEIWRIIGVLPQSKAMFGMRQYMLWILLIIIWGMAMCVFGASFITQRITSPLHTILKSMEYVRKGRLERIKVISTNQEIDNLQRHYNKMLDEMENLMTQKVEEQRMRRKYELSLLQAQIKPHFLYNTFDSVCALAMMGKTKDVYTMMQALGQYYRGSLHKGQEIITVKEELSIVENYLIIQSYRYDDVFEVIYDVDESIKNCFMIKLILQPLVENAIYHGFRENDLQGTIQIRAKDDGDFVLLQVEDDGIGMDKEKLEEVVSRTENNQGKRFGLFGTLQRINLYYQQSNRKLVDIKSQKGKGTTITIWIPKEKDEKPC